MTFSRPLTILALTVLACLLFVSQASAGVSYQTETFTSSNSWTVPAAVGSIDILAVGGGGGGGGGRAGGGGGGGEVKVCSGVSVTPGQTVAVTVGSGGSAGASGYNTNAGGPGSNSTAVYQSNTVCQGAAGVGGTAQSGNNGGTGGPSGAGKAGGLGASYLLGGGGGGASGNGGAAYGSYAGGGGDGLAPSAAPSPGFFSTQNSRYGGGGGGGDDGDNYTTLGGLGGGGNGYGYSGSSATGSAGTANSGGGGGGASTVYGGGGAGGTGYVEIRYRAVSAPTNSTAPTVSGAPIKGQDVSTGNGSWTGSPSGYTYKWQRCDDNSGTGCVDISSEAASTYTLTSSDAGKYIRSQVTATNLGGNNSAYSSNYIGPIANTFDLTVTKSGSGTGTVIGQEVIDQGLRPGSVRGQTSNAIDCGLTCSNTLLDGAVITLTATPSYNSTFVGWSGDKGSCDASDPVCLVTVDQARTIDAQFDLGSRQVTVNKTGTGSGTVVSSSEVMAGSLASQIDCGSTCTAAFPFYTTVTLTATADADSEFVGWPGECDRTDGNKCYIDILPPPSCTASGPVAACAADIKAAASGISLDVQFDLGSQYVGVTKSGSGSGTVTGTGEAMTSSVYETIDCGSTCMATYPFYTTVTLTATADSGSTFGGWSGNCDRTDGNKCYVDILPPPSCTATNQAAVCSADVKAAISGRLVDAQFDSIPPPPKQLIVSKSGNGTGLVTSSLPVPSATRVRGIDCGDSCDALFYSGAQVTLTATADSGSTFAGWSGSGCSGTGSCLVTMDEAKTVNAEFNKDNPAPSDKRKLTVEKSDGGSVSSDPSGIDCGSTCQALFDKGAKVKLTAKAATGYKFTGFSGACSGTANPCEVDMSQTQSVKASFQKLSAPQLEIQINTGRNSLRAGQRLPVTIDVENSGEETATGVTVCFTIPRGFSFVSATKPYTIKGKLVCWKLSDLAGSEVQAAEAAQFKVNLRALHSARSGSVRLGAVAAAENSQSGSAVTAKTKVKVKKTKRKSRPVSG